MTEETEDLFKYELSNNTLLKSLKTYPDIVNFMVENEVTLLLPVSVTIESISITKDFILGHVIISNPKNNFEWITMNGYLGQFTTKEKDTLKLISPFRLESFNPLLKDLKSLFDSERNLYDSPSNFCPEIVVLRFGQINLESKTLLPLLIISEPLPITPSNSVSSSVSFVEPKKENSIPQLPNKSIEPVTTSNLNVKEVLFGNTSSPPRVPLFPKEPEVINEEKKTNSETANPSNSTPSKSTAAYFFQKLRSPEAADIVRYINGFLSKFATQTPGTIFKQGTKIREFINGMQLKIMEHNLWKDATDEEIEGIEEGLEKYIMTKLYDSIFVPHSKLKENIFLAQRINQLQFITYDHLDIHVRFRNDSLINLAGIELNKMNSFKTPKDKLVCILNCCKVIYNMINASEGKPTGADDFFPILIYIVIRSNPKDLHTNIEFISNFRNPNKMGSEAGYYFTHLISAVAFLKDLNHSKLTGITKEEYQKQIELAKKYSIEYGTQKSTDSPSLLDLNFDPFPAQVTSQVSQVSLPLPSQPNYTFMNTSYEELHAKDIPELLKQYKDLVSENIKLRALLEKNS